MTLHESAYFHTFPFRQFSRIIPATPREKQTSKTEKYENKPIHARSPKEHPLKHDDLMSNAGWRPNFVFEKIVFDAD